MILSIEIDMSTFGQDPNPQVHKILDDFNKQIRSAMPFNRPGLLCGLYDDDLYCVGSVVVEERNEP